MGIPVLTYEGIPMDLLLLKICLSFIVGGAWITLVTILTEKAGSKLGGLVASLPSNMLVSFFFIGWAYGPTFASEAASVFPLASLSYLAFLFVFVATSGKYGLSAFGFGLAAWLAFAIPLGLAGNSDIALGVIVYAIATTAVYFAADKYLSIASVQGKRGMEHGSHEVAFRAIFAGTMVAATVAISNFAGPVWGGILVTFPAAYLSTSYLLSRSAGLHVARATTKVMLLSSAGCVVYAVCVSISFPSIGIFAGTALSYLCAVLYVLLVRPIIRRAK
ncbi:MAG: DUF3147 family protein [Candidatus Micrarchaeia archaeon]|jgi:hypothetical protein